MKDLAHYYYRFLSDPATKKRTKDSFSPSGPVSVKQDIYLAAKIFSIVFFSIFAVITVITFIVTMNSYGFFWNWSPFVRFLWIVGSMAISAPIIFTVLTKNMQSRWFYFAIDSFVNGTNGKNIQNEVAQFIVNCEVMDFIREANRGDIKKLVETKLYEELTADETYMKAVEELVKAKILEDAEKSLKNNELG